MFKTRLLCLLAVVCCPAWAFAQGTPKTLITNDNWNIKITYFPTSAANKKESPVVVFLHGEQQHRKFWEVRDSWPEKLQKAGVAAITVDLRKHGDSKPPGDSEVRIGSRDNQAMVAMDLEAVKHFIFEEHQAERLNMRKMAIVASDMSAPIAISFAGLDWLKKPWPDAPTLAARTPRGQDVRALVLISPQEKISGVNASKPIAVVRNPNFGVAVLVMYAEKDPADDGAGKEIFEKFKATDNQDDPRVYEVTFPGKSRGLDLVVGNTTAERNFLGFVNKHLVQAEGEWVNRKSPVDTSIDD